MKDKKSFLLYCDLIHTVEKMPDNKAGELFKHILSYVNDLNPETDDLIVQLTFEPIKQQLKRDLDKWKVFIEKQSSNGALGGRPKNPKKGLGNLDNPNKPKKAVTVTDTVNDNVTKIEFEVFYDLYQKKVDGKDAKIKWDKLDLETQQLILIHVPKYVRSSPDKQYRKSPLVYLNKESWNDEVKEPPKEIPNIPPHLQPEML